MPYYNAMYYIILYYNILLLLYSKRTNMVPAEGVPQAPGPERQEGRGYYY